MSDTPRRRSAAAPFLIGCGVFLLLLLLCGGGMALFNWRGFQAGIEQTAKEEERARSWTAPGPNAPVEAFAPAAVADFELVSIDDEAGFPALGLSGSGPHAVYSRGDDTVEVSIYRMDEHEANEAFDEIVRRIEDGDRFPSPSRVRLPRSLRFSISPPELHGRLWQGAGWLVFVRSSTVADLEPFFEAYLDEVEEGRREPIPTADDEPPPPADQDAAPVDTELE